MLRSANIGGTIHFLAPECTPQHPELNAFCKKPTQDIYGFGLVVYQIANNGKLPYEDAEDVLKAKAADTNLSMLLGHLPPDTPRELCSIITETTKLMPTERAPMETVKQTLQGILAWCVFFLQLTSRCCAGNPYSGLIYSFRSVKLRNRGGDRVGQCTVLTTGLYLHETFIGDIQAQHPHHPLE